MNKKNGMSKLETELLAENARLLEENKFQKALLQDVKEHLIEVAGDNWLCMCCGETADMSVSTEEFPHKETCVLNPKQKV